MPKVKKPRGVSVITIIRKIQSDADDDDTVSYLETKEFDPNGVDRATHTPVTMAAAQGKVKTLIHLLARGGDVGFVQRNGHDAVSAALHNGHYEVVNYLMDKGGNFRSSRRNCPDELAMYESIYG